MEIIIPIIAAIVGIGGGAGAVFLYNKRNENGGKNKADDLVRKAKNEAQDIVSKARKEAADIAEKSKSDEDERRKEWRKTENRLSERETLLDGKLDQIEKKSEKLVKQEKEIEDLKTEIRDIRTKQQEKLEKIAGLTKAEAKDKLMESAMALGAKVYEELQKEQAANANNEEVEDEEPKKGKKSKKDDVIDAEYEEK